MYPSVVLSATRMAGIPLTNGLYIQRGFQASDQAQVVFRRIRTPDFLKVGTACDAFSDKQVSR